MGQDNPILYEKHYKCKKLKALVTVHHINQDRHPSAYSNVFTGSHTIPRPPLKTIPPLQRKNSLKYEMPEQLCQFGRVQVLQGTALQDVTPCHADLLFHCNISLAEVNEIDTGCPQTAQQSCTPSSLLSACHQLAAENNNFT